jgi:hypothetical protein
VALGGSVSKDAVALEVNEEEEKNRQKNVMQRNRWWRKRRQRGRGRGRRNCRHKDVRKHKFIKDDMSSHKEPIGLKRKNRYTPYTDLHSKKKCKWKFLAEVCEYCKARVKENKHNQRF